MQYDLLHIQGKPYVLIPLHDYRALSNGDNDAQSDLPATVLDALLARAEHPIKIIRKHRDMTQE